MNEILTKALKQVVITGKTYTEYIAALADHLLNNFDITQKKEGTNTIEDCAEITAEMPEILISINSNWCALIKKGIKTAELRKTRPNIKPPFKVRIYETKSREGQGLVIGEFICRRIDDYHKFMIDDIRNEYAAKVVRDIEQKTCVKLDALRDYIKNKDYYDKFYIWHISSLVIYDKPRKLNEFKKPCNHKNDCCTCDRYDYIGKRCYDEITRPPQSWCYCGRE